MVSSRRTRLAISLWLLGNTQSVSGFAFTEAIVDFSIGAVAGGVGAFVAYPADYVKCQMQTESGKVKYKNGLDCFVRTITEEGGPLQLYRGVGVQVAGIAPEKSIKLTVNDIVKNTIATNLGGGVLPLWGELVAGSVAGICQVVATSPVEVLKVGLQTSDKSIEELYKEMGGIKGLFRGAEACILRDIIFSAALFPIYLHSLDVFPPFVAGSIAGVAAGFVGTPPDFVKTRILAQDGATSTTATTRAFVPEQQQIRQPIPVMTSASSQQTFLVEYRTDGSGAIFQNNDDTFTKTTNPFVVAREIAETEGWQVMFTGVVERCIGSIPRFGVTLSLYDYLKVYAMAHGWLLEC